MVFCENVNNCSNYVDPKTVVEQRSALAVSSLNFSAAQLKVNEFSRTICGFNKKGAELVYAQSNHHKKRLTVILDTDSAVAVCKRSETNEWIVPFDIAGIDNDHLSGKKQHKKCARFIVHPDTVAIASEDMSLRVKIEETAKELVSHFIDDQWELVVPQKMGTDVIEFNRLKDRFMKAQCHIYRNADDQDRITISYVFKNSSEGQSLSVNSKNLSLKVGTLQSYKSSNDNDNVCSSDECIFGQTISLQHKKNGESNLILQVTFTWKVNQKLFSTEVKDYSMLLNSCGLFIELRCLCFNAKTCIEELCERVSTLLFGLDGSTHLMMMENTEAGIEECSRLLEASSISCQEQQRYSNKILDETNSDYSSEADDTSINKTSAKSLSVFVDGSFEDQDIVNDATFSSSPTESSDSGVYSLESLFSSQSSSPNLSPVHKTPNRLVKWESVLSQQPVNVRQRSTSEGCGLKSILKRTLPAVERRGRFTRSLSECQQEIEVKVRTSTNGSSEEIDTPDGDDVRKKHVSFSERLVQRHSFRPNSSILGQRKKNQKKSRNKLKKKLLKENLLQTQLDSKDVNELDEQVEYESDVEVEKSTGRRRLLRSSICEESYVVFGSCVMNEDLVNNVIQEEAIEICS